MKLKKSSGCVLDLRMKEGSGSVAGDSSRYSNDGAVNGSVVWTDKGMLFDGNTGYITLVNSIILSRNNASVSIWFKVLASPAGQYADVAQLLGGNNKFQKYIGYDTNEIRSESNTNGDYWSIASADILDDEWHHLVLSADSGTVYTYFDGDYTNSKTPADDLLLDTLGGAYTANDSWHNGIIDGVRIYNRALSQLEIKQYYDSTKHKYV